MFTEKGRTGKANSKNALEGLSLTELIQQSTIFNEKNIDANSCKVLLAKLIFVINRVSFFL